MLLCKLQQYLIDPIFIFLTVPHHFDVQVFAKLLFPPQKCLLGLVLTNVQYLTRYFTVEVTGQHYNIIFKALNDILIDSWHIVESVSISNGRHFGQIVIALFILCQHYDLITVIFNILIGMVFTNEEFTANNRRNLFFNFWLTFFSGFLVFIPHPFVMRTYLFHKVKGAHHIGVIC